MSEQEFMLKYNIAKKKNPAHRCNLDWAIINSVEEDMFKKIRKEMRAENE